MLSILYRIYSWQLYSTLVLRPSRALVRILGTILWLLGIYQGKALVERVIEKSGAPKRTDIQDPDIKTIEKATTLTSNRATGPESYNPNVERVLGCGSTSIIGRLKPGVVLKYPRYSWWSSRAAEDHDFVKRIRHSFYVEEQILRKLGEHPRIIKFLGSSDDPKGLLFVEASDENLQAYLDHFNDTIDIALRLKWCTQAAEAIEYIHQNGVIHSDLRPDNYLLHTSASGVLNLFLADFGGSTCGDIDGGHLPDSGFFNPRKPWDSTEETDIFSLGSVFYTVMTGHWPYKSPGPFESVDEQLHYGTKVDELFSRGEFPTVEGLAGGIIIQGCWTEQYKDVGNISLDQRLLFREVSNISAG